MRPPPRQVAALEVFDEKDERVDCHQAEADDQRRADRGGRQLCDRHALDPGRLDKLHAEHRDVAVDDHEQGVGDQMHDPARAGRQPLHEQIDADVLVLAVGIGRADEHRVHEAGGGDLLAPDDDIVKQFSRDHVDDDEQDRYDHHRARDDPVKIFQ